MARRADHTREELRALALKAAGAITERSGFAGLTARRLAKRIGYSSGTLYNVFDSFTDLSIQMNGQTLDRLYDAVTIDTIEGRPESILRELAHRYIAFTTRHANLWAAVLDPSLPRGDKLPEWYQQKMRRLLGLVDEALAPLFGTGREQERLQSAHLLWSSLHGICSLVNVRMLITAQAAIGMADLLIDTYLTGLRQRLPLFPSPLVGEGG